ncbi:MAG: hypothetical protein IAE78_25170 [Myxococcus sp.]|nr:hypothetical protein [Myxococcus sp.]
MNLRNAIKGFDAKLRDALKERIPSATNPQFSSSPLFGADDDVLLVVWDGKMFLDPGGRRAGLQGIQRVVIYSHATRGGDLTPAGSVSGDDPSYSPREIAAQLEAAGAEPKSLIVIGCDAVGSGLVEGLNAATGRETEVDGTKGASRLQIEVKNGRVDPNSGVRVQADFLRHE